MRAIVLYRHGGPDVLHVRTVPDPTPGPGEVRVRIEAVGVNFAEVLSRKGRYGWAPPMPYTPGMETTGAIELLGSGVERRAIGDRVIVGAQHGAYAEKIVVPARQAFPAIAGFSIEENAAIAVNYLTASVALMEMARLRPADRVLVTAAAEGVGTAAVQIATRFGCATAGLAGSDAKLETIRALGAESAVNYRRADSEGRLRVAAGRDGFDVALETVGGEVLRAVWPVLAPFGRVVVAGFASLSLQWWNPVSWLRAWRDLPRADIRSLAPASHGLLGTHIGYLLAAPTRLARVWEDLMAFVGAHGIRPVIGATFAFEDMRETHRLMESRRSVGEDRGAGVRRIALNQESAWRTHTFWGATCMEGAVRAGRLPRGAGGARRSRIGGTVDLPSHSLLRVSQPLLHAPSLLLAVPRSRTPISTGSSGARSGDGDSGPGPSVPSAPLGRRHAEFPHPGAVRPAFRDTGEPLRIRTRSRALARGRPPAGHSGAACEARRPGARRAMARLLADRAIDAIRDRFGWESVGYASVALDARRSVPDAFRELAERQL